MIDILKLILTCLILLSLTQPNRDMYTLPGSFGFYQGSVDMTEIESVIFTREAPEVWDERWTANLADSWRGVIGYRDGLDVYIVGDKIYANPRCSAMFAARNSYGDPLWNSLTSIKGLELLDTSHVETMKMMFNGSRCSELDGIGEWDVSQVRNFAAMFQGSDHIGDMLLTELNIGDWDTSAAENMSHMFYGCGKLTYVPVENWDVSNVETFSHMFADCFSLESIDISRWETLSVRSFDAFLNDCRSLREVDVSGLDVGACEQFSQMFEACVNLEWIIGLEKWDVSKASSYAFSEMFHCCYSLRELDLSGWWAPRVDNTARMFKDCRSLEWVDISGLRIDGDVIVSEMFWGCKSLNCVVGFGNKPHSQALGDRRSDYIYIGGNLIE